MISLHLRGMPASRSSCWKASRRSGVARTAAGSTPRRRQNAARWPATSPASHSVGCMRAAARASRLPPRLADVRMNGEPVGASRHVRGELHLRVAEAAVVARALCLEPVQEALREVPCPAEDAGLLLRLLADRVPVVEVVPAPVDQR